MGLSLIRHEQVYLAIKTEHDEHCYPISALCKIGNVSRAAYYKWLHRELPNYEAENKRIADEIEKIHTESPDKGYRRIRDGVTFDVSNWYEDARDNEYEIFVYGKDNDTLDILYDLIKADLVDKVEEK